ncbi:MAG TPA: ATP-binding cassette domain-containing protein [Candidatus Saccharimonadia bacterium]
MSKIIELEAVQKIHPGKSRPSLHPLSFFALESEFIVIIGPSGCGKTTLCRLISGLEEPTAGTLTRPDEVAMVFQSGALFPWLTVAQNLAMVLEVRGIAPGQVKRKVRMHLEMVGLHSSARAYPRELSAGQRQRVGLARAMAIDSPVMVLDEPFAALDIKTTALLHDDLLRLGQETKKTIIMVSHSIEEAVTLADRILLMNAGRIVRTYHLADLAYPRREAAENFIHQVHAIRRDFLALGE